MESVNHPKELPTVTVHRDEKQIKPIFKSPRYPVNNHSFRHNEPKPAFFDDSAEGQSRP